MDKAVFQVSTPEGKAPVYRYFTVSTFAIYSYLLKSSVNHAYII